MSSIHPKSTDLTDPERDVKRMQPEETTLDLPDANEIPGQEHVHVPQMKQFHDTTISSDDEEGKGLFEQDDSDEESDVTDEEKEWALRRMRLDASGSTTMDVDQQEFDWYWVWMALKAPQTYLCAFIWFFLLVPLYVRQFSSISKANTDSV